MKRTTFSTTSTFLYAIFGFVAGILWPIVGMFFAVWVNRIPVGLAEFIRMQRTQPLLWIIDTAPLFLALTFGLAGRRQDNLIHLKASLQETVLERTSDLQRANRNCKKMSTSAAGSKSSSARQKEIGRQPLTPSLI